MIKLADETMFPALIWLWQQSFGDSVEYIHMFLKRNFNKIKTLVYMIADTPVSATYLLPAEYVSGCRRGGIKSLQSATGEYVNEMMNTNQKCLYLYAAATMPEYRGCGYFAQILSFIKENVKEPVLLVPAEEKLIAYYEKHGFVMEQEEFTLHIRRGPCKKGKIHDISAKRYFELREQALRYRTHIRWSEHFIKYICEENQFLGGRQVCISWCGERCIVLYRIENERLTVLEILSIKQKGIGKKTSERFVFEKVIQFLLQETGYKYAKVCIKPRMMMYKNLAENEAKPYFNLTLG